MTPNKAGSVQSSGAPGCLPHMHRFLGAVANSISPHTLRIGFDSPEQGAASRANINGRGFFTPVKLRARLPSMVGRVGRAQALPVLVRSVNPARPTTPFDSVAVGSDLSQGATMADPRNTGAITAVLPSLVHIDGTSNATVSVSVGVNPMLVSLTLSDASVDRWHFTQDMPPSAARELAAAMLTFADAVEGIQS